MKQAPKAQIRKTTVNKERPASLVFGLVALAFIFIVNYTPNLNAFDTNAPKFLAMAIVNLAAFLILVTDKQTRLQPAQLGFFFKTGAGLLYSGFIIAAVLSMLNAINLIESLAQFVKVFTVFSSVYVISTILMRDMRYMKWLIVIVAGMLLFDALSVFYFIGEFIRGKIVSIVEIKSIYSNKNILASAIFVKLPFALWLLMFTKGWQRTLGWIGLAAGITATFFMATRAFYLGLLILTLLYLVYMAARYLRNKDRSILKTAGYYLGAIIVAYFAFTGTRLYLYPKSDATRLTQGVGQQLGTISTSDASINVRLQSWKWSLDLLGERPLLGIGTGNWKVMITKYEGKSKPDFEYLYKAHNDFIEIAAETGLLGGLLYIAIFAAIAWAFLKMIIKGAGDEDEMFRNIFLAATGLAFYAVDAVFNFPADRPEILVMFVIYLSTGIAVIRQISLKSQTDAPPPAKGSLMNKLLWPSVTLAVIALGLNIWLLNLNFISSKTQRIIFEEIQSGKLRTSSDKIIAGLPFLPSVNILGEPISVQKARYLLNERKYEQALAYLRPEKANPWDGRREYFMSMAFSNMNQPDSALYYSEKLRELKPKHAKNILIASQMLEKMDEFDKAAELLETYLADNKNNAQVWTYASGLYDRKGDTEKAWEIIEEARNYLPDDSLVLKQHRYEYEKKFIAQYRQYYTKAVEDMDKKDYTSALENINLFITNVPGNFDAHQRKAYIYYYQGLYRKCIEEVDYAFTLSGKTGLLVNLKGVCYYNLQEMDSACKEFAESMKMGDKDGTGNYERLCKSRQQ